MSKVIYTKAKDCASSGCVEVGKQINFKTPSPAGHSCIEVGKEENSYFFRDSKTGHVLGPFTQEEWDVFTNGIMRGDFD